MSKLTEERAYFKPFNYAWAYDAWLKHEQSHWLHTEVPMSEDVKDWNTKLSDGEKGFLTNIFRFFVQGDIDVAGGYVNNYLPYFSQPEVCFFFFKQKAAYEMLRSLVGSEMCIRGRRITTIEGAGVYVPSGKTFYPSTVLMNIVPARVAGTIFINTDDG